jgi:hypothetical protein
MRACKPDISVLNAIGDIDYGVESVEQQDAEATTSNYELLSDDHIPEHNNEETVANVVDPMPVQPESTAILAMCSQQSKEQDMLAIQDYVNRIIAEVQLHPDIRPTIRQELARVTSLCIALQARPQLPTVSRELLSEPANKLAVKQRQFYSTKQKKTKRQAEVSISKPTDSEKKFLLAALDGTVEIISRNEQDTDHDYDVATDHVINFEHSY